jgi:hypothetical protein
MFVLFVHFLLAILLSARLRFTSSGYPLWYLQTFLIRLSRVQLFMLYIKVKMIIVFEFVGRIDMCRKDWHLSGELAIVGRIDICRED